MRPDRESKPRIFTEYVRALDPRGEPPGEAAFWRLFKTLRMALRSELKKKGLWESPPAYLGIEEGERWEEAPEGRPADGARGDALEELVKDCYLFIFEERLRSLKVQLRAKPNVDGLVFLNIRHFLHERQRQHDPIGFRVFQVLHAALERALGRGELRILAGNPRIRNDTLVGWSAPPAPSAAPFDGPRWAAGVGEALLPALIEARGSALDGVLDGLRERLVALGAQGVEKVGFRDLVDPLKGVARGWAAARLQAEVASAGGASPADGSPEAVLAAADSYAKLTRCVEESLARRPLDARAREYALTLWRHERTQADDTDAGPLSQRKLAERLGIPRDRLPELRALLRQVVADCRAANRVAPPLQGGRDER